MSTQRRRLRRLVTVGAVCDPSTLLGRVGLDDTPAERFSRTTPIWATTTVVSKAAPAKNQMPTYLGPGYEYVVVPTSMGCAGVVEVTHRIGVVPFPPQLCRLLAWAV